MEAIDEISDETSNLSLDDALRLREGDKVVFSPKLPVFLSGDFKEHFSKRGLYGQATYVIESANPRTEDGRTNVILNLHGVDGPVGYSLFKSPQSFYSKVKSFFENFA